MRGKWLSDVRHVFAAAVPRQGGTLQKQARDALETIEAVISDEGSWGSIVKQAVFYSDQNQLDELRGIIREFYGTNLSATTYVPQRPCDGKLLAIEALGVGRGYGEVEIERRNEHVVVVKHQGISWVHCGQIMAPSPAPTFIAITSLARASCRRRTAGESIPPARASARIITAW